MYCTERCYGVYKCASVTHARQVDGSGYIVSVDRHLELVGHHQLRASAAGRAAWRDVRRWAVGTRRTVHWWSTTTARTRRDSLRRLATSPISSPPSRPVSVLVPIRTGPNYQAVGELFQLRFMVRPPISRHTKYSEATLFYGRFKRFFATQRRANGDRGNLSGPGRTKQSIGCMCLYAMLRATIFKLSDTSLKYLHANSRWWMKFDGHSHRGKCCQIGRYDL